MKILLHLATLLTIPTHPYILITRNKRTLAKQTNKHILHPVGGIGLFFFCNTSIRNFPKLSCLHIVVVFNASWAEVSSFVSFVSLVPRDSACLRGISLAFKHFL
jgi:hypothetical protein